jgi:fatty acid desaturase
MICISNRCKQHSDRCPTPGKCGALPIMTESDEAQDRKKAPSMYDVLRGLGLWVAVLVVAAYLASLYAGWLPTWSGWPRLVAFAAF